MDIEFKESCIQCSTNGGCPFSMTDYSEHIQNMGCLPTPKEIVNMRVNHNKTWACHSNHDKPCLGALNYLKKNNLPFEVVDTELLTEDSDWHKFIQ